MQIDSVLFLHPGMMGVSLAAACGTDALWVSEGRSPDTVARALAAGLNDAGSLTDGLAAASCVVSICPPAAAEAMAEQVAGAGFDGVYVDANAISPATARRVAGHFANYVDGSVIGPPASKPGTTRLYLSGEQASSVAQLWEGSAVDARMIDGGPGAASALKMAYASWTKIGSAMALAIRSLAAAEGVDEALVEEWNLSQPGMVARSERAAAGTGPKAWRFVGEMHQIADAFAAAGLPAGFAEAGAEIYEHLAPLKGTDAPGLDEVLELLGRAE
jgi:hypothetical protein